MSLKKRCEEINKIRIREGLAPWPHYLTRQEASKFDEHLAAEKERGVDEANAAAAAEYKLERNADLSAPKQRRNAAAEAKHIYDEAVELQRPISDEEVLHVLRPWDFKKNKD